MKIANAVVFAAIVGASAPGTLVAAEHTHQEVKPRHGGVVVEVSDVEYELVKRDATYVIHVSDHGKPISTKGWSGTIVTIGGEKASAELVGTAGNLLEVKGGLKVPPGTRLLGTIQAPGMKPVQVRFTVK